MIKIQTRQYITLEDWDNLVIKTYGRHYSFQQQNGCQDRGIRHITIPDIAEDYENNTIPERVNGTEMGISFVAWLARDPTQKLDTEDEWERENGLRCFWERNFYPDMQMVANDLHSKGLIPAGAYAIEIDW